MEFLSSHRLRIFTWHIHGSYLFYLSQGDYDIYIPLTDRKSEGYYGRGETFPFGDNVIEVPAESVRHLEFDCIVFQTATNYLKDQYEVLSEEQRTLPAIYLEHNTPEGHPTNTPHVVNDPRVTVVHVTHFNKLMWQNSTPAVTVIEHGVMSKPESSYTGEVNRGVVVINHIKERGRIAGWDIFEEVRQQVPIDLIGMGSEKYGGLGEVLHPQLPQFISRYRFFFNPMRYTSLGLAVLEAMMAGMPIVALATTEYATVIRNGCSGFVHTDVSQLIAGMHQLLREPDLAHAMGMHAHETALERFNIHRFKREWTDVFRSAITKNEMRHETNCLYQ